MKVIQVRIVKIKSFVLYNKYTNKISRVWEVFDVDWGRKKGRKENHSEGIFFFFFFFFLKNFLVLFFFVKPARATIKGLGVIKNPRALWPEKKKKPPTPPPPSQK